jgi:hypothetical protein
MGKMTKNVMLVMDVDDKRNVFLSCQVCGWGRNARFHFNEGRKVNILDIGSDGRECRNPQKAPIFCEMEEITDRETYCIEGHCECVRCSRFLSGLDCLGRAI